MRKALIKAVSVFLSCVIAASAGICASAANITMPKIADFFDTKKDLYIEGEAIAALKSGADGDCLKKQKASSVYGDGVKLKNTFAFKKNSGTLRYVSLKSSILSTKDFIARLNKNPNIKYAFPNFKHKIKSITNDAYSKFQWALENNGQNGGTEGEDIKIKPLWDKAEKSGKERVVAVIDTGIDYKCDEFKNVLWENPYGNKLLGKYGYDFSYSNADGNPLDDNGHGTHISGVIAAASGNGKGISGMNKKNVKIMAVKVLDKDGDGSDESILAGFEYVNRAMELGTEVCAVNCSLGDYGTEETKKAYDDIINALGEKGAVTCVAAGNEKTNLNDQNDPESDDYEYGLMCVPACCDSPYCITVGAIDENGDFDDYSNYGDKYVDIAAPGDNILSNDSEITFNPTVYSSEQRDKLCAYYQSFDGEFKSGDFGYPEIITEMPVDVKLSKNVKFSQSDRFFGLSGKSLEMYVEGKKANKNGYFAFEIPFSIEDEEKSYDISFAVNSKSDCMGYLFDVPADYDVTEDIDSETYSRMFGAFGGNDWPQYSYNIDVKDEGYEKAKDRKLVFLISAKDELRIDDLAVSKQLDDRSQLGKYGFKSGTSMATAFVTGAAALVKSAYPDTNAKEVVNIVRNTGKVSPKLEGKTKNAKTLTLDTTDKFSPMVEKAGYDADGNIKIKGIFNGTNKVFVDGKEVNVIKQDSESIVIPDNDYNIHIVSIKVENVNGSDTLDVLLSDKKALKETKIIDGVPMNTESMIAVSAGQRAYFIDTGTSCIGVLDTESVQKKYTYTDEMYSLDFKALLKNEYVTITSAVYYDNKLYFTVRSNIMTSGNYYALGYETFFVSYDLNKGKLKKLCEVPDECTEGASLGVLNGKFYLMGGFVKQELKLIDSVYLYNAKKNRFEKTSYNLPEPRAYSSFIEYGGKLVGFWGAVESGELPKAVVFNGKGWKTSTRKLESSDFIKEEYNDDFTLKTYSGNVGADKNGVFCNGSFIEGYGDIITYDVVHDKIIPNEYCYRNKLTDPRLIGTTVIGGFAGFNICGDEDDYDYEYEASSINSKRIKETGAYPSDAESSEESGPIKPYFVKLNNTSLYPKFKKASLSLSGTSLKAGQEIKLSVNNGTAVSWSTSNKKVAVVNKGKVSALKSGTAVIYARLSNDVKLSCNVSVLTNPSIKISGKKLKQSKVYSIKAGKKLKLGIRGKAASVNNSYASTNMKTAKVVSKKTAKTVYIKAYNKGKASITVKVNGVSFKIKVKVV